MRLMKVLIIGTDGNKSGASLSMVVLAKKLTNYGVDVQIVIPNSGPLEMELNDAGIKYYIVRSYNWIYTKQYFAVDGIVRRMIKELFNYRANLIIKKILKEYRPNIVHINTICSGIGARPAIEEHIPLIWHIREFVEEDHGYQFWNKHKAYSFISKANLLIAISDSIYKKFSKVFTNNLMETIYNGVDVEKFYYSSPHIFEKENEINIYMVGSIAESKGQHLLIEAVHLLKKNLDIELKVHFLGGGNEAYLEELRAMVKMYDLETTIVFEGFKQDIYLEWRKADIAVVASRAEAFGRVTVEAMLAGALVIGSNTAGTAEIIKNMETGILFKAGDPNSLSEQIEYAMNNQNEMKKIALNGQKSAVERFSADRNAKEIFRAYKKILKLQKDN